MNDCLRVTGYDKISERLTLEHEVPAAVVSEARNLAKVGSEDDGLGIYPLNVAAALKLGLRMDRTLNVDLYDWFLEPRQADPPHARRHLLRRLAFIRTDDGEPVAGEGQERQTPTAAVSAARSLAATHPGAVAFSRTGDPATGDFGDAVVIETFGEVPSLDDLLGEGVTRRLRLHKREKVAYLPPHARAFAYAGDGGPHAPQGFIRPCAPTILGRAPRGPRWTHEIKQDRYRLCCRKDDDAAALWTRARDWRSRYRSGLPDALNEPRAIGPIEGIFNRFEASCSKDTA